MHIFGECYCLEIKLNEKQGRKRGREGTREGRERDLRFSGSHPITNTLRRLPNQTCQLPFEGQSVKGESQYNAVCTISVVGINDPLQTMLRLLGSSPKNKNNIYQRKTTRVKTLPSMLMKNNSVLTIYSFLEIVIYRLQGWLQDMLSASALATGLEQISNTWAQLPEVNVCTQYWFLTIWPE